MNSITTYQDLLDRDHAALVAECKRIDDALIAERLKVASIMQRQEMPALRLSATPRLAIQRLKR